MAYLWDIVDLKSTEVWLKDGDEHCLINLLIDSSEEIIVTDITPEGLFS
jgi:hypothetical protein